MTTIDCAQNNELVKEFAEFLHANNYSAIQENELLIVNGNLSKSLIESFLEKTNRPRHKITLVGSDSFLIAIPVSMDEIGLEIYEFCGYTSHHELVSVHRKTHQAF